ncbi:hypothetical protein AaE_012843 [Aphanomyces astaci]|uniref:Integrase catalytic domain-containing protein n=1 Tax=Aphanomyces astaci TaxID=112090 RepID=A0A6A4ZEP9_APHAT|nr:hypothetical protein AaE_012843 [Aphanomyces astaci]
MQSIQDEQYACKCQNDSHSLPEECWQTVSADWITGLPVSKGYDAILVVVDKLSKRPKYIPTRSDVDAPQTAKEFFEHVVRHHGLPAMIISDRDPKFTSTIWKSLMEIMGQDWVDHLPTIEYAHQGLVQASTGLTPFEVDTGRKLRNPAVSGSLPKNDFAKNFAEHRKEFIRMAHENLTAQQRDQVLLATRNLPLKHAQMLDKSERSKLVPRFIGPFEIVQAINDNTMRLKLPRSMSRVHDVFNVDRLKNYQPNETKSTSEEMYIVEKLLKKRQFNRKLEYLVKSHGYTESEATWELMKDIKHVVHFKPLVQDLESRCSKTSGGECSEVTGGGNAFLPPCPHPAPTCQAHDAP